jgi:phosphate ABC transporter phosphate-binding protein
VRRATQVRLLAAAVLLTGGVGCSRESEPKAKLRGAGSSFVKPMMDRWVAEYAKIKGGEINYSATGSTNGIKDMTAKALDFGATDAPMTQEQLNAARDAKGGGEVLHIPLVMGGIVPAYNVEGVKEPLNFTGEVLADIYLGNIKRWDDDKIKAINKGVNLPGQKIAIVSRSDGSGSTHIFTDYLCKVSPEFKKEVGQGTKVKFRGSGENGTAGVAGFISKTSYSLGYVELTYALQSKIPYGKVKNRAGKFVAASLESVREAAVQALKEKEPPENLCFSITDAPGEGSYPLAGTTWAVFYAHQPADFGKPLVDFFSWVVHDGQKMTEELNYSPLPEDLVKKIDAKLKTVQTDK